MALKSKIGTTSQVLADIANIGIETSVTITDNLYTATNLLAIIAKTNKTITLQNTAAGDPADMTESAANLVKILAQVNKYTGPLTVTGTTTTAEQLNYIAKKTTGKVTAELVNTTSISKETVDALKDVNSSDNITFTPTVAQSTLTGKAALEALVALDKKLSDADWTAVATFNGAANEVNAIKAALTVVPAAAVTITAGQISAADANALVVASKGNVTADIKDGSVAATLNALKDVAGDLVGTNTLKFKTTDRTADAMAIFNLDDLLGVGNFDGDSVKTITSKAADAASLTTNVAAIISATNADAAINITNGTITATQAATISAATTGKVTANIATGDADTIANALNALTAEKDALSITVDGANADGDDLLDLDAATSSIVKVDAAEVTAATFTEFESIYVTGKAGFSNLGDENITIDAAAPDMNSAKADIVAKATSKIAKANITGETAALVATNLKNANAKDAFTIILAAGTASAKDLLTLDSKTSVTVDASAITDISGTVAEINKLLAADVDVDATAVNYDLSGTVKAADASTIASKTAGNVTATIAADTAANLDANLRDSNAGTNVYELTVNGATASAANLASLATKANAGLTNTIKVDAKEITGTLADLKLVLNTNKANYSNTGNKNVKISGAVASGDIADLNIILAATEGIVTATVGTASAATLKTIAVGTNNGKDALTLVTNDSTASAADLLALDAMTSVKVNATAITTNGINGNAAQLKQLVASKGVELAKAVAITVTGATNASDLATILKSTLGTVTALNVTADTAAKLNAALKDAISTDALTLKVDGTTATAKDLISLDGKTSVAIAVNVGAITGNIADITNVFVSNAANFTGENTTAATISGTVEATQANAIANATSGVVTATVKADTAAILANALGNASDTDKLKLTVTDKTVDASDLKSLDGKTVETVNASSVTKIVDTSAADVYDVYLANSQNKISGLGNELVDLTGSTDADVALVNAINNYTTGLITLPTVTFDKAPTAAGKIFNLAYDLGDLKGITGLEKIDANNVKTDTINISLNDILAANDGKTFSFDITNEATDTVNLNISGWSHDALDTDYTDGKTFTKGGVTIELTVADDTLLTVL